MIYFLSSYILRRPKIFVKSSPYFWLQYIQSKAETLEETIESGPLCTTDLFQNKIRIEPAGLDF